MIKNVKNRYLYLTGPLIYSISFILLGLFILTLFRSILAITYFDRLSETPEFLMLFPVGLRMDILLLSYLIIIPSLLILALPKKFISKIKTAFALWFTLTLSAIVYMEIATFPFIEEYDLRPDRKFFEYLVHPKEVFGMLWAAYKPQLVFGSIIFLISVILLWKLSSNLITKYSDWSPTKRLIVMPFVTCLLVLGARSTLGHRPANLSTAAFSNNHFANELALNSTYSVIYAGYRFLKHEKNPSKLYGSMEEAEVLSRLKTIAKQEKLEITNNEIPFYHKQKSPYKLEKPLNIVIFLQESVGAIDVGCLKGPDITPNLCKLKEEGLWFSNLYATGTRTVRGIEATVSGFLPTANRSVVKLGKSKKDFFTAASLLKKHGYQTNFIYGGMSNFDEMRSFFLGNGFDEIYDEPSFKNPKFASTWGVSDEDLVIKANEVYKKQSKPFFSVILSTSNHSPYEFPDNKIDLYEQPKETHHNAVKYADYAIGKFFELAKKEEYYKDTLFLIVADHNSHVKGNDLVPINKFHIPGLLIGPNVPKENLEILSSQIDLMPTILHFSGLETMHPMIGRNLMNLSPDTKGRAFMQYASNAAYRVEDQVIIMRPFVEPLQFKIIEESLISTKLNKELALDALAYSYLPWILYSKKLYKNDTDK
ncbi:UNVERIFIED_CONTAM: hypothetical protein GTU68_034132 [Idotea baltica]|nr:hypothetical protein [Idotea baltica]